MKCETCGGKGYNIVLVNYADFHFNGDYPITEEIPCEDCFIEDDIKTIENE